MLMTSEDTGPGPAGSALGLNVVISRTRGQTLSACSIPGPIFLSHCLESSVVEQEVNWEQLPCA